MALIASGCGFIVLSSFEINGTEWTACEDLQAPDGAIVLVSSGGRCSCPSLYPH